ncbi:MULTISPECIES: ABC transporter substrate-binding protein [unclassified Blastococcus]
MRRRLSILTSVALVLAVAGCGGGDDDGDSGSGSGGQSEVTFLLDFAVDGLHAPLYVAQEEGYFGDRDLAVQIEPGQGGAATVQLVSAGRADMGLADAGAVSVGIGSGAEMTAVGVILKRTPTVTVALADSGIATPQDLAGRSYGDAQQAATTALLPAFLEANGVSRDAVDFVGMSFETRVPSLQSGQVDAIGGFAQEFVNLEDITMIPWFEHGIDSYGTVIVANTDWLADNADVARDVLAAVQQGLDDTLADPQEAARLTAADDRGDEAYFAAEIEALDPFFSDDQGVGLQMSEDRWRATQELMVTYGGQTTEVPIEDLFTNEYLG